MIAVLIGVAGIYLARGILAPVALAAFLAFVLSPLVEGLERRRVNKAAAVILVVMLTLSLIGGVGWVLSRQLADLTDDIPKVRENLRWRMAQLHQATEPPTIRQLQGAVEDVIDEVSRAAKTTKPAPPPVPVIVRPERPAVLLGLPSLLQALATAGFVGLLTVFMLIERRELRNRLIRLSGTDRLPMATRALDEVSGRISGYLLSQAAVNAALGLLVGIGLWLIGIPYPLVWGVLTALLRFVPFFGIWIAVVGPLALSLNYAGWTRPLLTAALFLGLELLLVAAVEPRLYSWNAGVSRVALLVVVGVVGWLWGPLGLILATPVAVCLVVVGRYVPGMGRLADLLSDRPVLEPWLMYYQRVLAGDASEAMSLVNKHADPKDGARAFDAVVLAALGAACRDRVRGILTASDEETLARTTLGLVPPDGEGAAGNTPNGTLPVIAVAYAPGSRLGEVALRLLAATARRDGVAVQIVPADAPSSEVEAALRERELSTVCIVGMPDTGAHRIRLACKRLRGFDPNAKIVVGSWGQAEPLSAEAERSLSMGADAVTTTLRVCLDQLRSFTPPAARAQTA